MNDGIIKDCLNKFINDYNFRESADIIIFLMDYLGGIEGYEDLVNMLKMIYDLL